MDKNPNINEIVRRYLEEKEFDGLFCRECSCENSELFPCGMEGNMCRAGHKIEVECKEEGCDEIHDFHIGVK